MSKENRAKAVNSAHVAPARKVKAKVAFSQKGDKEDSYNDRETARVTALTTFLKSCEGCGGPIYVDPGYCTSCAWDR
jgi:hypothetical protein